MPQSRHPVSEARRDQMFPVLEQAEVGRLWRFGELKSYEPGDRIAATGEIAPGAFVILSGRVEVTQRGMPGHSELIVAHGPGSFMGGAVGSRIDDRAGRPHAGMRLKPPFVFRLDDPRGSREGRVDQAAIGT